MLRRDVPGAIGGYLRAGIRYRGAGPRRASGGTVVDGRQVGRVAPRRGASCRDSWSIAAQRSMAKCCE